MAEILKGSNVANFLTEDLISRCRALTSPSDKSDTSPSQWEAGFTPTLAIFRIGENPSDISYETGASKRCEKIGINIKKFILPENSSNDEILNTLTEIKNDNSIHGCLMFRPLKDKALEKIACEIIAEKDSDIPPCTAQACIEILDFYGVELEGKNAVVLGRSEIIGKPVAMLLLNRNATVTICHSKTKNLPEICKRSDIIISAMGKAKFIDSKFVSEGQVIIDVGINFDENNKLCGDVNFDDVEKIVSKITPVPGGVGAVTTSVLAKHVIEAAERRMNL